MSDETEIGSAGTSDSEGRSSSGGGFSSPFQARAQFFKNWDWNSLISINQGACARGKAQHGISSETGAACASDWEKFRLESFTLAVAIDRLHAFHCRAPFFFFNGNTFATLGRELMLVLFRDLPPLRKREASSAVAHYIAGVLERDAMIEIVESVWEAASFDPGDRVKTLRGTMQGRIIRVLEDGRVVWQPHGSGAELIALPESLRRVRKRKNGPA